MAEKIPNELCDELNDNFEIIQQSLSTCSDLLKEIKKIVPPDIIPHTEMFEIETLRYLQKCFDDINLILDDFCESSEKPDDDFDED